jgi:DNA-3-methyladenine glycosylase II
VLLGLKDRTLVAAGLSGAKIRTLRALATAAADRPHLAHLDRLSDAEVHTALTAVNGIGPWTADVYLMFCLGRADAWAAGDLALQLAAKRHSASTRGRIAKRCWNWLNAGGRGAAWRARLLWAYYAVLKGRAKAVPV